MKHKKIIDMEKKNDTIKIEMDKLAKKGESKDREKTEEEILREWEMDENNPEAEKGE